MLLTILAFWHGGQPESWWSLLGAACLAGIAGWALVAEVWSLSQAQASKCWPVAEAEIIDGWIDEHPSRLGGSYEPVVRYRYWWQGQEWKGTRLAFGQVGLPDRAQAKRVLDLYPVASRTGARVHPVKPERAVLLTGRQRDAWFRLAFFAVITTFVAWILLQEASGLIG